MPFVRNADLRHAEYYRNVLGKAMALYLVGNEALVQAVGLIDMEWGNIRKGQNWAASNILGDPKAAELCVHYAHFGENILSISQPPNEHKIWYDQGLIAAQMLNDRRNETRMLRNIGMIDLQLGNASHAAETLENALSIAVEIGDPFEQESIQRVLGHAYITLGSPLRAFETIKQAKVAVDGTLLKSVEEDRVLYDLGLAYVSSGEISRGVTLLERALDQTRLVGAKREEAAVLIELGNAYLALDQPNHVITLSEQAQAIFREIGDLRGEGHALGNLGRANVLINHLSSANKFFDEALAIARKFGTRNQESLWLKNLADTATIVGNFADAIVFSEQLLTIAQELGNRKDEGEALGSLANNYQALGYLHRAIDYYEKDLAISREIGDRRGEAITCWNLGQLYEKTGEIARAYAYKIVCVEFEREIGDPDAEKDAVEVEELRSRLSGHKGGNRIAVALRRLLRQNKMEEFES